MLCSFGRYRSGMTVSRRHVVVRKVRPLLWHEGGRLSFVDAKVDF